MKFMIKIKIFLFSFWWWKLFVNIYHDIDLMAIYLSSNNCVTPVTKKQGEAKKCIWLLVFWLVEVPKASLWRTSNVWLESRWLLGPSELPLTHKVLLKGVYSDDHTIFQRKNIAAHFNQLLINNLTNLDQNKVLQIFQASRANRIYSTLNKRIASERFFTCLFFM